jgi:hypothetical protein
MEDISKHFETNEKSLTSFFDFFQLMQNNEIILIYSGEFSQDLTKTLLAFTERKLSSENLEDLVRKKIFNIMVEMLQNISKNAIENNATQTIYSPVFMIGESDQNYLLLSSNKMLNENIPSLKNRLDEVNSLDSEGLKGLYKQVRLSSTFSNIGGAGIGIIDMARKSEKKLSYNFTPINNTDSLYSLLIKVSKTIIN